MTNNIYCDESCHLQNDGHPTMTLGALMCPTERVQSASERIREIKAKHGLSRDFEIKWVKVSPAKRGFYEELLDYFFDDDDLRFRGIVIPAKGALNHEAFLQTHDDWYYKMLFRLLEVLIDPSDRYRIFLDIKDTRSAAKARKLREVLQNAHRDFEGRSVLLVQNVRSEEVELMQLADLLIGAVGYANRSLDSSPAKLALVERIRKRSRYQLTKTTVLGERKFNLLIWSAEGA